MKRFLIAFLVLSAGTSVFCGLKNSTAEWRHRAEADSAAWEMQTRLIVQTRAERQHLERRVQNSERELSAAQHAAESVSTPATFIPKLGQRLSPAQDEKLLAELGLNWNSTGNYVVVSKDTLQHIRLDGMKDMKLSDLACQVLAITPDERATIEATTEKLGADFKTWAEAHVQRDKPSGDIVAKYTLPADPEFSQSLSNAFASTIMATLGRERGNLLLDYSRSWMVAMGMESYVNPPVPTTMTVSRYGSDADFHLTVTVKQGGNFMQTDVSPWQPFPVAFQPLFPGGWRDLAAREGFALPKQFRKTSAE